MSRARPKSHRGLAAGAIWQWHFALWLLLFRATTAAIPAAAQTSEGGAPSTSGAGPEGWPGCYRRRSCNDAGAARRGTPDLAASIDRWVRLFRGPAAPPYSVNNQIPTLTSPATLPAAALRWGRFRFRAYDPNAPAILIQPSVSLGEIFTDNVNFVPFPADIRCHHTARELAYRPRWTPRDCKPSRLVLGTGSFICRARTRV